MSVNHVPAPGFAHPTRDAQLVFRSLLDALAHPGTPYPVTGPSTAPVGLGSTLAAVLLTVLDEQSPVYLAGALHSDAEVADYLAFHTGAHVTTQAGEAAFVVTRPEDFPDLRTLALGTDEAPHESATVVVDARGQHVTGSHVRWIGTGPGIRTQATIHANWAPPTFLPQWQRLSREFPRGVDVVVVTDGEVVGLPRTTQLAADPDTAADAAAETGA